MRAGSGDAYRAAMSDPRAVSAVTWHRIPIPAIACTGAFHSLLEVTVGGGDDSEHYAIEKGLKCAQQSDKPEIVHAVTVSLWASVRASVAERPHASADGARIVSGKHTMRSLHGVAAGRPYNLASANCHHAALEAFNACVVENARIRSLPNSTLASAAGCLELMGIDPEQVARIT